MNKHDVQARSGFLYMWTRDGWPPSLTFPNCVTVLRYNVDRDPGDEDDDRRSTSQRR